MNETLDFVLRGLMRRYTDRVPDVGKLFETMVSSGIIREPSEIENDHIAFRTMGVPQLGIASLEKIFLHLGYTRCDAYRFEQKKLDAFWYKPPQRTGMPYPRIFISELRVGDLSQRAQETIQSYTDEVPSDPVDELNLDDGPAVDAFLHQALCRRPTWADYDSLLQESEYAAWVIYNRYYLNHFTVSVHNLPSGYDTLEKFNMFLQQHGFHLNDSGGVIKVSRDGLLAQSSTVAAMLTAEFDDSDGGEKYHQIAGSYLEFAERRVMPEFADLPADQIRREHRRDGFEASNADKIFESTYTDQTQRGL